MFLLQKLAFLFFVSDQDASVSAEQQALKRKSHAARTYVSATAAAGVSDTKKMCCAEDEKQVALHSKPALVESRIREIFTIFPPELIPLILSFYGRRYTNLLFDQPIASCSLSSNGTKMAVRTVVPIKKKDAQKKESEETTSDIFVVAFQDDQLQAQKIATRQCNRDCAMISGDGARCVVACNQGVEVIEDGKQSEEAERCKEVIPAGMELASFAIDFRGQQVALLLKSQTHLDQLRIDLFNAQTKVCKPVVPTELWGAPIFLSPNGTFLLTEKLELIRGFPWGNRLVYNTQSSDDANTYAYESSLDSQHMFVNDDSSCLAVNNCRESPWEGLLKPISASAPKPIPRSVVFTYAGARNERSERYRVPLAGEYYEENFRIPKGQIPKIFLSSRAQHCLVVREYNKKVTLVDLSKKEHEELRYDELGCEPDSAPQAWAVADNGDVAFAQGSLLAVSCAHSRPYTRANADLHSLLMGIPKKK